MIFLGFTCLTFTCDVGILLVTDDYLGVNLDEEVLNKNLADTGVNVNLRRDELNQECLIRIADGNQCDLFKEKDHDAYIDKK